MWTFKRILIMMGSLFVALCAFAVYALILGGIDGLPPLPAEYYPPDPRHVSAEDRGPPGASTADQKLQQAFGPNCKELRWPYRLWLPEKKLGFAAGQFDIDQKDGRVKLAPFSLALYHKDKSPGAYPEISTIRAEIAWLTLDRPVSVIGELTNRKVIGVELQGRPPNQITITNNRRTAEKSDDLDILISGAPLFYDEKLNIIRSEGVVSLTDNQTKPPTTVSGRRLEMLLTKETGAPRPANARVQPAGKSNDSGGIERLTLRNDVDMHFFVDSRSTFLTGSESFKKPVPAPDALASEETTPPSDKSGLPIPGGQMIPPGKAHIHIRTPGSFVYEVPKEFAWFENSVQTDSESPWPTHVSVARIHSVNGNLKTDQLTCDRLDLQFRHRPEGAPVEADSPGGDKEIETAKATARPGNEVVIALDSEGLAAEGNYLFYRAGDATHGAKTLLKGEPLRSYKDGNNMVSRDLLLVAANLNGEGRYIEAAGPGKLDLLDKKNLDKNPDKNLGNAEFPIHLLWKDKLVVVTDKEGTQTFDLMKVYGDAAFIDDVQKQQLQGERIFAWLINSRDTDNKKPQANGPNKQAIHRVRAEENVRASSPEFNIARTNILIMTFVEKNATEDMLPNLDNNGAPTKQPGPPPTSGGADPPGTAPPAAANEDEKKPNRPVEVTGNEVTAEISTLGTKKQLQELVVKGNVFVFQAGEKPGEKSIDIQGQLLTMKHGTKGDTLVVHGEPKKLARLEIGDLILWGQHIRINQEENRADVEGIGAMEMPSNSNFDGTKSTTGTKRITIHWKKNMTFDGKQADFYGSVMAFENGALSKMLCEDMTAILDRRVVFQQAADSKKKDKDSAKIDQILCIGKVFVDDVRLGPRKELEQRNILTGAQATLDNPESRQVLVGPGEVRSLGQSSSDGTLGAPAPAGPKNDKLVWKLTRVEFPMRMWSNTKANAKNAKFYGNPGSFVEVQSFPTTDINAKMNIDAPPKDGFYMRCEFLNVEGRQNGPKTTQYMLGERNVFFRTDKYFGNADIVKYDESTEIVILEALPGKVVQLYQVVGPGSQPAFVNSTKVLYNRRTGEMKSEGVKSMSN